MLGSGHHSEKMVISSSTTTTTTNEWSQVAEQSLMGTTNGNRVMDQKPAGQEQQQQPQQTPLKCPRCDSLNTKFCYYNNYSLSQPRHFCKACKRYWTRGGTLRNVPVGGGYRKNKRVKRPSTDGSSSLSTPTSQPHGHIDVSATSNGINPLFYGLPNNSPYFNLSSFPRFNSRSSDIDSLPSSCNGYDTISLNYPSLTMTSSDPHEEDYGGGFNNRSNSHIQDLITSSNSLLSNFSLFGSSSLGSSKDNTRNNTTSYNLQGLLPFQNLQMGGNNHDHDGGMVRKEVVKMEEGQNSQNGNKLEWSTLPCQNPVGSSVDPSLYWNSMSAGAWPDLTNYGSSWVRFTNRETVMGGVWIGAIMSVANISLIVFCSERNLKSFFNLLSAPSSSSLSTIRHIEQTQFNSRGRLTISRRKDT